MVLLKNNFPLYSELIICPQLHTLKVNEPLTSHEGHKIVPPSVSLFRGLPGLYSSGWDSPYSRRETLEQDTGRETPTSTLHHLSSKHSHQPATCGEDMLRIYLRALANPAYFVTKQPSSGLCVTVFKTTSLSVCLEGFLFKSLLVVRGPLPTQLPIEASLV